MKPTQEELTSLAESLIEAARQRGADQAEVSIRSGRELAVNVRDGDVEGLTEAGTRDLGLRVFVGGRMATASSSDLTKATLLRLVDNAIARARLGGVDECAGLPERGGAAVAAAAKLALFDPEIAALPAAAHIKMAKAIEAIGLADGRLKKSLGSSCQSGESTHVLVTSHGFSGSYTRTLVNAGVGFQGGAGDNLVEDGWDDTATHLSELMPAEAIAKKAVTRVARLVGARKVATQNVPVVFEAPIAAGLLLGFLARCINGAALARKQSFLADKLGATVGNARVDIYDDGLRPRGVGTRPFDDEGVASRRTSVIERGVLKSYLLDTYYGRKLKLGATGHAGGLTNFTFAKGDVAPEAMVKSIDKGLLLTGTLGQGTMPATGDISIGAFGMWIEKGELAYPVAEITISGNLGELLQNVELVGSDLELRDRVAAPSIKVKEMTISGIGGARG